MSVYKKLNDAREAFHQLKLTKTGLNKFAGYNYFELGDFLIPALKVFREHGLCAYVSFDKDIATMTIADVGTPGGNPERITITSPMGSAALKGCHEVQNIGAVETYQRRYLWVAALEIVEHDALDATTGKKAPIVSATKAAADAISPEDRDYLRDLAANITALVSEDRPREAWEMLEAENLDDEQKPALWSMLGSGARSAIKKAKEPATV